MKRIKSKLAIAVIAVAAIVLIAGVGASAYWTVQYLLAGNQIASGHLVIDVNDYGLSTVTPLSVSNLMPGGFGQATYTVESAAGNPLTDLAFSIPTVTGEGTLKDNVKVAFLLTTNAGTSYWLDIPSAVPFAAGTENTDLTYVNHGAIMSAYALKTYTDLPGYTDIAAGDMKHIRVYYWLPLECASDCHDSTVTFDMSFELLQSH